MQIIPFVLQFRVIEDGSDMARYEPYSKFKQKRIESSYFLLSEISDTWTTKSESAT